MGAIEEVGLSPDELMCRWAQVLADEALVHLPYKIELDQWGEIRMTPVASPRHVESRTEGPSTRAAEKGEPWQR